MELTLTQFYKLIMKSRYYQYIILTSMCCLGVLKPVLAQSLASKKPIAKDTITLPIKYIGYDTQDAAYVTSAISTIKGKELLKTFNVNLVNKLNGRLAGLTVSQGGNEPGFNSAGINSRGRSSYQGINDGPLILIDGFLGNFEQLVPEEIEEISLLKDASATGIYGFRGANGVLLVTTKRGKNSPLKVTFSSQLGFTQATQLPKTLNAFDYATLYNEAAVNDGKAPLYDNTALEAYRTGSNPIAYYDVNWYDQVTRKTAPVSNYNLNFNGGSSTVKYFLSLNAVNNQGLLKDFGKGNPESSNSTYSRYNFRSNVEVQVNKRFSATLLLGGNLEDKFNPFQIAAGSTFNTISLIPANSFPVYIPNGSFDINNAPIPDNSYASGSFSNPLANLANTGFTQYTGRTFQSAFKLKHELDFITPGLSVASAISFNNYFQGVSSKTKQVQSYKITPNGNNPLYSTAIPDPNFALVGGEGTVGQNRVFAFQGFLNYKRTFGKHDISGLLFYNSDNNNVERSQPTTSGPNNAFPYKTNGGGTRITYVNSKKYIGEFTLGYMGSENFAKGKRYGFFPAGSIGWIASNEDFLKQNKTISFLKLRASYGIAGSDDIGGRFLFEQRYPNGASYLFGTATANSLIEGRTANPNITWEKEKKANIGLDATFFNQLNVSLDLFNQDRYDILSLSAGGGNIPSYLGFNQLPFINEGKVNNKGFEAVLGYNTKANHQLTFFASANVFYAKNKIEYGGETSQPNAGQLRTGYTIGVPIGLVALGLFQTQDEINTSAKPIGTALKIGDIRYADIGGPQGVPDGIIDENDVKQIGNTSLPNLTVGLNMGLKYKGFDLDVVIQAVGQRTVTLSGNNYSQFQNANQSATALAFERFTPNNTAAEFPRLSLNGNQNNYRYSSFYQRNGDFIKLRSAELGYSFSKDLLTKIKLDNARVFVNGTNLFSIDHIKSGDPEALGTGYPPTRTISFGARLNF